MFSTAAYHWHVKMWYCVVMGSQPWEGKPFENIEGKEKNIGKQNSVLFPQCLLSF